MACTKELHLQQPRRADQSAASVRCPLCHSIFLPSYASPNFYVRGKSLIESMYPQQVAARRGALKQEQAAADRAATAASRDTATRLSSLAAETLAELRTALVQDLQQAVRSTGAVRAVADVWEARRLQAELSAEYTLMQGQAARRQTMQAARQEVAARPPAQAPGTVLGASDHVMCKAAFSAVDRQPWLCRPDSGALCLHLICCLNLVYSMYLPGC